MGLRRLLRRVDRFLLDDAVTPVIGSILILAITILGIAGILLWGAPTLQSIQDQNAQVGMVGEFHEMRRDTLVLSITDSSRVPRVNQETGSFAIVEGTRMQISAMFDADYPSCDFHVTGWEDSNTDQVAFSATSCRDVDDMAAFDDACDASGDVQFEVFRVTGGNAVEVTPSSYSGNAGACTVTLPAGEDVTKGDWRFRISDGSIDVYADSWLFSTKALDWSLQGQREMGVRLEYGAIFSQRGRTIFLEQDPAISEEAFGNTADFVLRLPDYNGTERALTGRGSPSVFLSLVGNNLRISTDNAYALRFHFLGDFAEAWCNGLRLRNSDLSEGSYAEDASYPCSSSATALQGLKYTRDDGLAPAAPDPFAFEFIHARIVTGLQA